MVYLVEGLVGVSDKESPLIREVVVEIGNDLDSNVSLSSTGWTNYQRKTMLHTRQDGLYLSRCERNCIPAERHMQSARKHVVVMRIVERNFWPYWLLFLTSLVGCMDMDHDWAIRTAPLVWWVWSLS